MNFLIRYIYTMISEQTIDQIKSSTDIVDVISDFVTLKKTGDVYKALSPFVNERTASFYVVPAKGIFKDFASGKGGDAITFLREHEGIGYIEALKYLAKKYGIHIEEHTSRNNDSHSATLMRIVKASQEIFSENLLEEKAAKDYLHKRGFTENDITKFSLGYSTGGWQDLMNKLTSHGYQIKDLVAAGLVVEQQTGKTFDKFRNRVMFPIHNLIGNVVGFGARLIEKQDDQPKYLNSPETVLYKKSEVLYGLYQAKNHIRKHDECFLVEGYTDVIAMCRIGIENVVSSSGTALSSKQIHLIKRFTSNITIIYDGDAAGIRAAIRGIDIILQEGINVRIVRLPEGEDPDSFARNNADSMRDFISNNKKDFITFKTELLSKEAGADPIKKAELIKDVINSLSFVSDLIQRSVFIKQVASLLGLEEQIIITELNKKNIKDAKLNLESEKVVQQAKQLLEQNEKITIETLIDKQEREVVRVLLNYGDKEAQHGEIISDWILNELDDVVFANNQYKLIIDHYRKSKLENKTVDVNYFVSNQDTTISNLASSLLINRNQISSKWKEQHNIIISHESERISETAINAVRKLKLRLIQKMLQQNIEKLKLQDDLHDNYLNIHIKLKKAEVELAQALGMTLS